MAFPDHGIVIRVLDFLESNPDLEERFFRKVRKYSHGCWTFTGSRGGDGYGYFFIPELKCQIAAHRFSYLLEYGVLPEGLLVLHECDNKPCVRPDHLFLGTWKDNMVDKTNKGRNNAPAGMRNGGACLTDSQVMEIFSSTSTVIQLSEKFGISRSHVSAIRCGHVWKHLQHFNDRSKPKRKLPVGATLSKLVEDEVLEIRHLHSTGLWTYRSLGEEFAVSEITVANICKRRTWKHI